MPIHIRAEPGQYADACLLPGDPLRAKYVAENFLDGPEQRNWERGMLGYTGTFKGKPVSVQATGMGCPSAAIVIEELAQLGVKRLLRIGTCGGLQPDMKLGDLIVALSAVPADSTATHYVDGEPHAPTADWDLVHAAVHAGLLLLGTFWAWRLATRAGQEDSTGLLAADRMEQLQESVDAIAIEVERIGEAQRFTAKLKQEPTETDR